jgi:preprotein translocase subunit SecD
MLKFPLYKTIFILIVCFASIYFSLPTLIGGDDKISFLPEKKINLGLDLQGGSYLLLEVNFKQYMNEQIDNLRNDIRSEFRTKLVNSEHIQYVGGLLVKENKVVFTLVNPQIAQDVVAAIKEISRDLDVEVSGAQISVGYSAAYMKKIENTLLEQSVEIVRRRVDETGTREPDIQRQGENRILLQVPGLADPEHLKGLLGRTAKLTFHLLDNTMPYPDTGRTPAPPGTTRYQSDKGTEYFAIKNQVMLSGDLLADASAGFSANGQAVVNLRFNNLGAKKFGDITRDNVGKPFAIVLDNKVLTAPVIRSVILGGSAEISGSFTTKEASDLALLLRAGALPAPLDVVEERTVGPSLGADSVASGKKAIIIGTAMVMLFMVVVYKLFGLFANIALITNMLIITAVMSILGATLTMPGIAGIVLTIGMAVDANVLIFERIREELRTGRSVLSAVDNGFKHAFSTIFDAHITTLLATLFLYNFGSGSIKGFAITLAIGISASLFSAILVCKMLIVFWLKKAKPKTLSV